MSNRDKIKDIFKQHLGIDADRIVTGDEKLEQDLGADSLDLLEIVMQVEDEFNIEVDDSDLGEEQNLTFNKLCAIFSKNGVALDEV